MSLQMDRESSGIELVYVCVRERDVGRLGCGFALLYSIFYVLYSILNILNSNFHILSLFYHSDPRSLSFNYSDPRKGYEIFRNGFVLVFIRDDFFIQVE